jgi:hypothetical protein
VDHLVTSWDVVSTTRIVLRTQETPLSRAVVSVCPRRTKRSMGKETKALNAEQRAIVERVAAGRNAVAHAPPGTGKTAVVIAAVVATLEAPHPAGDARVLVCAYNTDIAAEMQADVAGAMCDEDAARVTCSTIHALCNTYIGPAHDDVALQSSLAAAEERRRTNDAGWLAAAPPWTHVFVDEAQDMTDPLARVLAHLLPDPSSVTWLLVGDEAQRVYDYGPHPASGELLAAPETQSLCGARAEWRHFALTTTYRLPPSVVALCTACVPRLAALRSAHPDRTDPVRVYGCCKSAVATTVADVVQWERERGTAAEEVILLVPQRAGNYALVRTMNALSDAEVPIYVHGVDNSDPRVRRGKLCASTFHASKGTEAKVVVLVGGGNMKRKPLFVGLTRASVRLHVVLVKGDVDAFLCDALRTVHMETPHAVSFCDALGRRLVAEAAAQSTSEEEEGRRPAYRATHCNLDATSRHGEVRHVVRVRPQDAASAPAEDTTGASDVPNVVSVSDDRCETVGFVYTSAVLMRVEFGARGAVRAVDDMLNPVRLPTALVGSAARSGVQGRIVNPYVGWDELMPPDLRKVVLDAYARVRDGRVAGGGSSSEWTTMACGLVAWNGYHHRMRQLVPVDAWVDDVAFQTAVACVCDCLPAGDVRFDAVLSHATEDGTVVHLRCHAVCEEGVTHFVWSPNEMNAHVNTAAQRAVLHGSGRCLLVCMTTGERWDVDRAGDVEQCRYALWNVEAS